MADHCPEGDDLQKTVIIESQKSLGVARVRLTICCDLSDSESSPVKAEDLVCVGYWAAVECAQDLLCRLVCGKLHKSVALRYRCILIPDDLNIHKLSCACIAEHPYDPGIVASLLGSGCTPPHQRRCLRIRARGSMQQVADSSGNVGSIKVSRCMLADNHTCISGASGNSVVSLI